ncbi:hypothetical protein EVAR_49762_1 [Eumeta japonica]|uniref:Uncharacterized protein n=1 Tax=Eumeta variegata TaxID=151549 RepID=A0A4C1Y1C0_EUMVA|nr:hypothetical protein EVAR_49762_1 [Eumeta japonica]
MITDFTINSDRDYDSVLDVESSPTAGSGPAEKLLARHRESVEQRQSKTTKLGKSLSCLMVRYSRVCVHNMCVFLEWSS